MGNFLKDYLTFTSKEKSGLVVLLSLILCVVIYVNLDFDDELKDETDMAQFAEEMAALSEREAYPKENKSPYSDDSGTNPESSDKNPESPYVFHAFDPNKVKDQEWKQMGLKDWQIKGLKSYRGKAGDIKSPEQFAKLNVISDDFFAKVSPFLVFGEGENKDGGKEGAKDKTHEVDKESRLLIELSIATAEQLKKLKGIGPSYSKRIVKYRNWLGGFQKMDQLLEVYGMKDSLYEAILPFLTLDTNRISKFNINTVMISQLSKHP